MSHRASLLIVLGAMLVLVGLVTAALVSISEPTEVLIREVCAAHDGVREIPGSGLVICRNGHVGTY